MERFELHMKGMKSVTTYQLDEFGDMKNFCLEMIDKGTSNLYEILYYKGDELKDTAEVLDYFGS
jgi:hypothetical protein